MNKFLLKLPEAGLSKEVLTDINDEYEKKFGEHIACKEVDDINVRQLEAAMGANSSKWQSNCNHTP